MSDSQDRPGALSTAVDFLVFLALCVPGILVLRLPLPGEEGATPRDVVIHRAALLVLSVAAGWLWLDSRRTRRLLRRMDDLLTDVRFGEGTRRDRDAVDILLRALRTPDARARETALRTLRKISGLDLGEDPAPWEEWWRAARSSFVRPGPPPGKK